MTEQHYHCFELKLSQKGCLKINVFTVLRKCKDSLVTHSDKNTHKVPHVFQHYGQAGVLMGYDQLYSRLLTSWLRT